MQHSYWKIREAWPNSPYQFMFKIIWRKGAIFVDFPVIQETESATGMKFKRAGVFEIYNFSQEITTGFHKI